MKNILTKKLAFIFLLTICLFALSSVSVEAAGVSRLCYYTNKTRTFVRKDITGDGAADRIRIKPKKTSSGQIEKLKVFVNGKKIATINMDLNIEPCYYYKVNHIVMDKKNVFLQIYGVSYDSNRSNTAYKNCIYQYDNETQTLKPFLNFDHFLQKPFGGWVGMKAHDVLSVSSSQIDVMYMGSTREIGRIYCTYTFIIRNGKIKLKSRITPVTSFYTTHQIGYNDSYNEYFWNNQFIASESYTFYKKPNQKRISFTMAKDDILNLRRIKITPQKTFLQFQKGTQLGWIPVDKAGPLFQGVSLRLSIR